LILSIALVPYRNHRVESLMVSLFSCGSAALCNQVINVICSFIFLFTFASSVLQMLNFSPTGAVLSLVAA